MAHPDGHRGGQIGEDRVVAVGLMDEGGAVLPGLYRGYPPPELVSQELHTVADAQDRQTALEDIGGRRGGSMLIDTGGPTREDEPLGVQGSYALPRGVVGQKLTVDLALPHAAGDEKAILGAEVQDDYGFGGGRRGSFPWGWSLLSAGGAGGARLSPGGLLSGWCGQRDGAAAHHEPPGSRQRPGCGPEPLRLRHPR